MQEALQRHAQGIRFRERNAGPDIDRDMSTQGVYLVVFFMKTVIAISWSVTQSF